jgi:hypothetical protein
MFLINDFLQPTTRALSLAAGMAVAARGVLLDGAPPGAPVH